MVVFLQNINLIYCVLQLFRFLCNRQPFPVSQSALSILILSSSLLMRNGQISSYRHTSVTVQVIILFVQYLPRGLVGRIRRHCLFSQIQCLPRLNLFALYFIASTSFSQPLFLLSCIALK
jgi:hypothetical protein